MCSCSKVIHGAGGLIKVAANAVGANIDRESDQRIADRRNICRGCEHATRSENPKHAENGGLTTFSKCQICGCNIAAKTTLASEKCPLGKW